MVGSTPYPFFDRGAQPLHGTRHEVSPLCPIGNVRSDKAFVAADRGCTAGRLRRAIRGLKCISQSLKFATCQPGLLGELKQCKPKKQSGDNEEKGSAQGVTHVKKLTRKEHRKNYC
jgi:hypothetical protein